MRTNQNFIKHQPENPAENLIVVNCHFIPPICVSRPGEGIIQLTVSARQLEGNQYLVRLVISLEPNTFLYSQDQSGDTKWHATHLEFDKARWLVYEEKATELGKRFIHTDNAYGLRPFHGNKVTFLQNIHLLCALPEISGRIYYQAFREHEILEPGEQPFKIPLKAVNNQ